MRGWSSTRRFWWYGHRPIAGPKSGCGYPAFWCSAWWSGCSADGPASRLVASITPAHSRASDRSVGCAAAQPAAEHHAGSSCAAPLERAAYLLLIAPHSSRVTRHSGGGAVGWRTGGHRLFGSGAMLARLHQRIGFDRCIGWAAEQRVEPLHVGDQFQVRGAGVDALHHPVVQAMDVRVGQLPFASAKLALLLQQLPGTVRVAGEEYRQAQAQVRTQQRMQLAQFLQAIVGEGSPFGGLDALNLAQHVLDDVSGLLEVDRQLDDFRPAPSFFL